MSRSPSRRAAELEAVGPLRVQSAQVKPMIELTQYDVPIAISMRTLSTRSYHQTGDPLTAYVCLWSAFDNIYTTIADRKGAGPRLRLDKDGAPRGHPSAEALVWEVDAPREADKLRLILEEFPQALMNELVSHPSTRFFATRTPRWHGSEIDHDVAGQG